MIELLEHNVDTYKSLCKEMEKHNKVALVQATGTGKSYIVSKYIEEHCNNALILVPANAIGDQWNNLLPNTDIKTYQAMVNGIDGEYDLIVADEMHHLGSEVWGQKFIEYFMHNPEQKVIGATATEIRYLDNARDMVEEIFNGVAVRGADLAEAIDKGILPTFRYVTAYHGSEQDFNEYRDKVDSITDEETRKDLSRRLEMCIENKVSIKTAMYENLSMASHNIIVFLNGLCEIDKAIEMFTEIFPECDCNYVSSKMTNEQNETSIEKFQKSERQISILFAVDMLNEGVHIKGVDSVVMFRNTESPQVYFQQMGRVLDTNGGSDRVVFDFVCNEKTIKANTGNNNKIDVISGINKNISDKKKKIILKTYTKELDGLFAEINNLLNNDWTNEEDEWLKNNYEKYTKKELAEYLSRTEPSVYWRAKKLGLIQPWIVITDEIEKFIRDNADQMTIPEMARYINVKEVTIRRFCTANAIETRKHFAFLTDDEKQYIIENSDKSNEELGDELGRSPSTIGNLLRQHGIEKRADVKIWSETEKIVLYENKHLSNKQLTALLPGRSESAINSMRKNLGLQTATSFKRDEIIYRYKEGDDIKKIADATQTSKQNVRRILIECGLVEKKEKTVAKRIRQIDMATGKTIATYKSAPEAAKANGYKCPSKLNKAARNSATAYGYGWRYAE